MTEETKKGEVKLKVVEALQDDAYKGIARIDTETMRKLGLKYGDIISIKGGKETVAAVDRAYPADIGQQIIRIDGIIRKNAKTGIGEIVTIKRADVKEAKKITIAPAQKGVVVQGDPEIFKQGLLGRAVVKGDIIVLGGSNRRDRMEMSLFEDDDFFPPGFTETLRNMGFGNLGFRMGKQLRFAVVSVSPQQPVIITENTELILSPKGIEISEEKVPQVTYEDIGGLNEEVRKIREMVEIPLKHPELFEKLGIEPPKGVLLHGPPGTGKTLLAKAVANESEANFIQIKGPSLLSMWVGKSEEGVRKVFERARQVAPCIIFFDEIDSLASRRGYDISGSRVTEQVLNQLLAEMDGLEELQNVTVIGATNRPDILDPAILRPGRFDKILLVNPPSKEGRLEIFKIHTKNMPLAKDVKIEELADKTDGYVGADIEALCREAALTSLRKNPNAKEVSKEDFETAMRKIKPSVSREMMEKYRRIEEDYLKSAKAALEKPVAYFG